MMNATPLTTPHPDKAPLTEEPRTGQPPKTLQDIARHFTDPALLTRWQRIKVIARKFWIKGWAKLGFGLRAFPNPPYDRKFASNYIGTETRIKLSFYERLQLIVSGRIVFRQSMQTWPQVKRSKAMTAMSILPPGIE
jgi:hypothetical protein